MSAQTLFPSQPARDAEDLSRPSPSSGLSLEKNGTAFFVDGSGHMLTAGHAAADCARLFISKEGQVELARLVALAADVDLALIKVPKTLGLSAVFPRSGMATASDMVFAAGYDKLPDMMKQGLLANATIAPSGGEAGYLAIDSDVTFGASGAPVLDSRGLVQGIVSRRTREDHVLAVDAASAKAFLAASGVAFEQDDRSQIAASGSRANRAASISARVTCLQN
ncbi:MAG TPA: serine protease [Methylovirgula sp.]|nr:serine protease [Methylovirgula sp.]